MAFQMFVDERGVPYSDYGNYRGIEIGRQRSVLSVAERGLVYWNRYFAQDEPPVLLSYDWERFPTNDDCEPRNAAHALQMLLNCADWLIQEIYHEGHFAVWRYSYPISYGTGRGWASSHAQAIGLSLLVRASELSGESRYADPTESLLRAFEITLDQGGLLDITEDGQWWYEKFASKDENRPRVLNGMLFSLLGLDDIAKRGRPAPAAHARQLFEIGLETVLTLLPRFDSGDWSYHDIIGKKASPHYHAIHIAQLDALHGITARSEAAEWRDRFLKYQQIRRAEESSV